MTMDVWTGRLSEYLDGDLSADERTALEAHLPGCAVCTRTLDGLRLVVARAARLEPLAPERDLWSGIAERIGAEPARAKILRPAWRERMWSFTLPQLAAAGVLLALLSGGVVWMALSQRPGAAPAPGGGSIASAPAADAVVAGYELPQYDKAIAELQQTLEQHRAQLDTSTVRIIEQNLAVIDQATDQARRALAADPANPYLNGHLAEQMRRKVDLLRQATALFSPRG